MFGMALLEGARRCRRAPNRRRAAIAFLWLRCSSLQCIRTEDPRRPGGAADPTAYRTSTFTFIQMVRPGSM